MANEINGFRFRSLEAPDARSGNESTKSRGATPAVAGSSAPARTDTVNLTDAADRLKALTAQLAGVPEIDSARVDALRQQIADGRYQPNDIHVAEKLVALEQDLFGLSKR